MGSWILAECPAEHKFTLWCNPVLGDEGTGALIFAPGQAPEAKFACSISHCGVILLLNIDFGIHFIDKINDLSRIQSQGRKGQNSDIKQAVTRQIWGVLRIRDHRSEYFFALLPAG